MTPPTVGAAEGSVRLVLTKTHPCSFFCPLCSRAAVSLSNSPATQACLGLPGPLPVCRHLYEARVEHECAVDTACHY